MADSRAGGIDDGSVQAEPNRAPEVPPPQAYRAALARYEGIRLVEIAAVLEIRDHGLKPRSLPGAITEHLGEARVIERILASARHDVRLAATLFALTETAVWPWKGLAHALKCLGADPSSAVKSLAELGLAAVWLGADAEPVYEFARHLQPDSDAFVALIAHPSLLAAARTVLPADTPLPTTESVRTIRETDGLEAIIRLAALWQRVIDEPLRQTQQATLYKRDRERLDDDPVLAGPIADSLEPLPDMSALWLALARRTGLLAAEPGDGERIVAAPPGYWDENGIHLPQMIAVAWLALWTWHEQGGMQQEGSSAELAWPFVRPAVLLWLASLPDDAWVSIDDLAARLQERSPAWDIPCFLPNAVAPAPPRSKGRRARTETRPASETAPSAILAAMLLGPAYQLGLVRAAESSATGARVVQLTALGRYVLALGPPPPARPLLEQFLFVQPNFEIIAYRQGLYPSLIGQLSRFARWTRAGAALELRMTPDSVYRGLEGGLTPDEILKRLARHSSRPLPAGVAEALRTWADRRDRIAFHASATLVEFASREELELAIRQWPADARGMPVPISDRLILVEDEGSIPFHRFRMAGSRDYRRPAEACVEVESDGTTLSLELARSDLMVDAELARFAEELAPEASRSALQSPRRRFAVTLESLARAARSGTTTSLLAQWYESRTGSAMPAAVRLMLLSAASRVPPLATERPLVLHTPSAEILDGLLQHPDTRPLFGERLGPTAAIVPDDRAGQLEQVLGRLGLTVAEPAAPAESRTAVPLAELEAKPRRKTR
jgi:hypothetical protein